MTVVHWLAAGMLTVVPTTEITGTTLPDDLPIPTTAMIDRSVQRFTDDHIARSVQRWSVDGSVAPLVEESTEGDETTLTLLSDLLFEFGSAKVEPAAATAITAELDDVPQGAEVDVVGHTDSIGSASVNKKLSEDRAKAVAAIIRDARPDVKIRTSGRGSSDPVADNTVGGEDNPAGRMLNRRVEVSYTR